MSGSEFHDIDGPMSLASDGPTLLMQLSDITMELIVSTPDAIIIVAVTTPIRIRAVRNASSDGIFELGIDCPLSFIGSTALG